MKFMMFSASELHPVDRLSFYLYPKKGKTPNTYLGVKTPDGTTHEILLITKELNDTEKEEVFRVITKYLNSTRNFLALSELIEEVKAFLSGEKPRRGRPPKRRARR